MILSNGRLVPELTRRADVQVNQLVPLRNRWDSVGLGCGLLCWPTVRTDSMATLTVTTVLHLVPFGEENAVSARSIWNIDGVWTPGTFKTKLSQLANEGLIERKTVAQGKNLKTLYFRKPGS
jgi:hypothetical protein